MTRLTKGVGTTETRYQLEAKVIAQNGISLSVMSERVRSYATGMAKPRRAHHLESLVQTEGT